MNLQIEGLKCDFWPKLRIEFANLGPNIGTPMKRERKEGY